MVYGLITKHVGGPDTELHAAQAPSGIFAHNSIYMSESVVRTYKYLNILLFMLARTQQTASIQKQEFSRLPKPNETVKYIFLNTHENRVDNM